MSVNCTVSRCCLFTLVFSHTYLISSFKVYRIQLCDGYNTLLHHYTKCRVLYLLSTELHFFGSCILCPDIPEGQGLDYTRLVSECQA